ncbi:UDP-2,4-diacetamido-2,4,6-trideoxy-beta-L-altropyranose hydrolase [Paenibacillus sp. FSL H7-0331]|nr:UDP-2,4-diacetamido-2,4,6-trideoxy-beta-L-altropyranose hydrolase [Paenibacillus sp. FSL H7-0331]OMF13098.1 UDP-2,4-diacetamido-2,4,6-trideoxy-beta-L-altropyranose hydrolase [Paenibacillus sp. FSL H7-0331]
MKVERPTILFRCDASEQIGSGHVMRCITLAQELSRKGASVVFATNSGGHEVIQRFAISPMKTVPIHNNYSEVNQLREIIVGLGIDYLIWDSYRIELDHFNYIADLVPTMLVDDIYLFSQFKCDAVLNQNIYATADRYSQVNTKPTLLMGTDFSMLRDAFQLYAPYIKSISDQAEKVLLTFGGADLENNTIHFIKELLKFQKFSLQISIVLGVHYPYEHQLSHFINHEKVTDIHSVQMYRNVTNMADLIWEQDLAVTAGGSTMYELACLGVPSLCVITADNQRDLVGTFHSKGISIEINQDGDDFLNKFSTLVESSASRKEMSRIGRHTIDGKGKHRVAEYILHTVRRAL